MKKYLLCLSLLLGSVLTFADPLKGHRVLFLLDGSSSMSVPYTKGQTRFQKAGATILAIMDSISAKEKDVEFALRVYGHQHSAQEKNCFDTKMEVPFSKDNRAQMELRLDNLKPAGISPLSYAIHEAVLNDLQSGYRYSVYIISDGDESCSNDICEEALRLNAKGGSKAIFINLAIDNQKIKNSTCFVYVSYPPSFSLPIARKPIVDTISIATFPQKKANDDVGYILLEGISSKPKVIVYQKMNKIKYPLDTYTLSQLRKGSKVMVPTGVYIIYDPEERLEIELKVIKGMITEKVL